MPVLFHPLRPSALLASLVLLFLPSVMSAQGGPDSVDVVLAPEFAKEWPYGILFGSRHQSLWTTPVRLPCINLSVDRGGLTAIGEVVNPDSRILILATSGGDMLAFSPLRERFEDDHADPRDRRLVPVHPSGALAADELAGAAGLIRSSPRLVWLPDDSQLGEFQKSFGGRAGFLSIPRQAIGNPAGPIVDTEDLFGALDSDPRNRVDSRAFLTARFVDLLTGDWERSLWKWWWVPRTEDSLTIFEVLPGIHRQSFLTLGSFPSLVHGLLTPGFVNFGPEEPNIRQAVATASALDARLLAEFDRRSWDSAAATFASAMTDSVIDAALRKLPIAHFRIEGDTLARALRARRDAFVSIAGKYYNTLAEFAEITLSNSSEYVAIDRGEGGRVEVTAWRRAGTPEIVYHRTFRADETREIRLHCLGGNDTVIVRGTTEHSIPLRVNGDAGDDLLTDESVVFGPALGFIGWIRSVDTMTYFYDHQGDNTLSGGEGTSIDTSPESEYTPRGRFF